ncbi:hypothetical protein [Streptomyces goshikiensis]|uniref:hypothetical protein n=1 Tax=Streptomyces goshikiensis TaxID=1942 RepID=UPI00369AC384
MRSVEGGLVTPGDANGVARVISATRFEPFLKACQGDHAAAERLYAWDGEAARALWSPVRDLEVSLRNALHQQLSGKWAQQGQEWYETRPPNDWGCDEIEAAKTKLRKRGRRYGPDDVVAELSFGFWTSLLSNGGKGKHYETWYWSPSLQYLFRQHRGPKGRAQLHARLGYVQTLRNRIAHHERIFHRDLNKDYNTTLELLRLVAPSLAADHDDYSQVSAVLARRAAVVAGLAPIRL